MVTPNKETLFHNYHTLLEPENGDTAMHIAACKNNDNMISFLLDMGANPNVVNQQGQTPVMNAAEYGHVQCLQVLADAGSDMTGI